MKQDGVAFNEASCNPEAAKSTMTCMPKGQKPTTAVPSGPWISRFPSHAHKKKKKKKDLPWAGLENKLGRYTDTRDNHVPLEGATPAFTGRDAFRTSISSWKAFYHWLAALCSSAEVLTAWLCTLSMCLESLLQGGKKSKEKRGFSALPSCPKPAQVRLQVHLASSSGSGAITGHLFFSGKLEITSFLVKCASS